jgi:hypothetical protein
MCWGRNDYGDLRGGFTMGWVGWQLGMAVRLVCIGLD